ncbi:MAG: ABC transporter permease subunit [Oscillospiraceae bacterium]|nr:ABC transporter permease subunit [Oscillospiraceae bacterium]
MKTSITKNKLLTKIGAAVFWILVWQIFCIVISNKILLPTPFDVVKRLFELIQKGSFWISIANSLFHIMLGFAIGALSGVLFAALSAKNAVFREIFAPVFTVIRSTPVASFIILALVWIKAPNLSIFITALITMPVVWSNIKKGIESTDKNLLEMADIYRFSKSKKLRHIYIPSVMPYAVSSFSIGIGFAWKSGIAAEVIAIPKGTIGYSIYNAKILIETADLFAWTVAVILLSLTIEKLVLFFVKNKIKF